MGLACAHLLGRKGKGPLAQDEESWVLPSPLIPSAVLGRELELHHLTIPCKLNKGHQIKVLPNIILLVNTKPSLHVIAAVSV